MTSTYDVNGEYAIHYRYEYEGRREVVISIVGYSQSGQPITLEELEKDYVVMDHYDLQWALDDEGPCNPENAAHDRGEAAFKDEEWP